MFPTSYFAAPTKCLDEATSGTFRGADGKSKGRQRLNTSAVSFKPRTSITIAVIKQVKMQSSWVLSQANKNQSKTQNLENQP